MICVAWISSGELLLLLVVGLLLFGGRLPDVAKDIGRLFLRARRSLEEIRRESGIDETLRDLDRESREIKRVTAELPDLPGPLDTGKTRGESGEKNRDGKPREESDDTPDKP